MSQLDRRIEAFRTMGARFAHEAPTPLILIHHMPADLYSALCDAVREYMEISAARVHRRPDLVSDLLKHYDSGAVYAVTPAGMIVPKRTSWLEFNKVVKVYAAIIERLEISDLIESWYVPLNVRFKSSMLADESAGRPYATEEAHSDSWAGASTEGVTVHIPVLGDTDNNYLKVFHPSDNFEESWLGPISDYKEKRELLRREYTPVDYIVPKGSLVLCDYATLHASTRRAGCGWRVSIDNSFVLRKRDMAAQEHPRRENERVSEEVLRSIGVTRVFYFPDPPDKKVDVPGFKHPTTLQIKELDQ